MDNGDLRDELNAEFRRQTRRGCAEHFNGAPRLPWGVFSKPNPDTEAAESILRESLDSSLNYRTYITKRLIAKYALSEKANPRVKLRTFALCFYHELLDSELLERTKKLLGRPTQTIRFDANTRCEDIVGSEEALGCVMEAMKRAGCCNPVILLENMHEIVDEKAKKLIEKVRISGNGRFFYDRCVGVPFDLSHVLFVELRDVSEHNYHADLIRTNKKIEVVEALLLGPILAEYAVESRRSLFSHAVLEAVIDVHTREIGFEECTNVLRRIAACLRSNKTITDPAAVINFIKSKFGVGFQWTGWTCRNYSQKQEKMCVGDVPILQVDIKIWKAVLYFARCRLSVENAFDNTKIRSDDESIAYNYCRQNAKRYGISAASLAKEFNIAVPPGKGSSGGCSTFISLFSALTNRRIRNDSGVTGVLHLSGQIGPIGGVYLKTSATYKSGMRRIVLPRGNQECVETGVDEQLRRQMTFVYVDTVDDLICAMMESARPSRKPRR